MLRYVLKIVASKKILLAKIGVDTAENEPCKVCPLSVYRSPRCVEFIQGSRIKDLNVSNSNLTAQLFNMKAPYQRKKEFQQLRNSFCFQVSGHERGVIA